jgi:hypothetical protein
MVSALATTGLTGGQVLLSVAELAALILITVPAGRSSEPCCAAC